MVARLYSRLARPAEADDPVVAELADGFAEDLDVLALLLRIFRHADFLESETRQALVKTPVDLLVGMLRALAVEPGPWAIRTLAGLDQVPFFPPDVAGWPSNEAWLSTSSALVRLQLANRVAGRADIGLLTDTSPSDRPAALARLLGVARFGEATSDGLSDASDNRTALTLALVSPEYLVA